MFISNFSVYIIIEEGKWGPAKTINYQSDRMFYLGYCGFDGLEDYESCMYFSIYTVDGEIYVWFSEDNDVISPMDYCDFYDVVDLSYTGDFEYSNENLPLYDEDLGKSVWDILFEKNKDKEFEVIPDDVKYRSDLSSGFVYTLDDATISPKAEYLAFYIEQSFYHNLIYSYTVEAILCLNEDDAIYVNEISVSIELVNGECFYAYTEPYYSLPLSYLTDTFDDGCINFTFELDICFDEITASIYSDSDEFLCEGIVLIYADNQEIEGLDSGKSIFVSDVVKVDNIYKLDSDYARECITMVEEDLGSLTTSGEYNEEYIERVNNVMNSFTTKDDLRNKLDFVCNSSTGDVLYDQGYDAGYHNGISVDVKDAIDKYIQDNNYHTNDEYLEHGRNQYLEGFEDGKNADDNLFDDLEDPAVEEEPSFFEELFTKDNLIYLICLVALCSFVASLFGRRR